jgi:HPt (histidine-containing phosphotransfer) domain-containing protein
MPTTALGPELFYSKLAAEPDLAELVELFVAELPQRLNEVASSAARRDWESVARLAHQLQGAGGSHGFPHIGPPAQKLEEAARGAGGSVAVMSALEELAAVCRRVRAGVPE